MKYGFRTWVLCLRALRGPGCFFFLLWPLFARAPRHWFLENFLLSAPGVQNVFFLLRSVGRCDLSAGPEPKKKKKHPGWCFFCCGPARTLTHSLRAWVAMPPPRRGGVCFFCCGAGPDRGGVFFFAVAPPGRSLTHCGLGRFRQGPGGVFFFAAAPPGLFRQ